MASASGRSKIMRPSGTTERRNVSAPKPASRRRSSRGSLGARLATSAAKNKGTTRSARWSPTVPSAATQSRNPAYTARCTAGSALSELFMIARPATRSGARAARWAAHMPPSDDPATTQRSMSSRSRSSIIWSARSAIPCVPGGNSPDLPWPHVSGTIRRQCGASARTCGAHIPRSHKKPCASSTGGPQPTS